MEEVVHSQAMFELAFRENAIIVHVNYTKLLLESLSTFFFSEFVKGSEIISTFDVVFLLNPFLLAVG